MNADRWLIEECGVAVRAGERMLLTIGGFMCSLADGFRHASFVWLGNM